MIWTIAGVLVVLWLLGFLVAGVGEIIHLLLAVAVIMVLYNVFVGRVRGSRI